LIYLIEAVAHGGGEDLNLLLHLDDHGGGGHRINLVSGYQCRSPLPWG
jgi:hypothetical protein